MNTVKEFLAIAALACAIAPTQAQRLAVLNDLHVSPGNAQQLQLAIAEINGSDIDAIIVNGDLTNEGSDTELCFVKGILDLAARPIYTVPGNHENNWSQSATKTFKDLWGNDRFCGSAGDIAFVGINCGPYMKMGDGHIKQEDLHWLRHTLDSLSASFGKIISFNHYPIRKDDLDNYAEYGRLLEQYPIIAHFNGHYHKWERYDCGGIPAVMTRALFLDNTFGYSIIDARSDSVFVYEKQIGKEEVLKYAFPAKTSHKSAFTDIAHGFENPAGFEACCVWTDSASIFTRLEFDGENVYFGNSLGQAKAVSKSTGALAWQQNLGSSLFSRPANLSGGRIAFPHAQGIAIIKDGEIVENLPSREGPYVADGIIVNDTLYAQGGYKRFELINAKTGELIWRYDSINNYCQASPASDGKVIVFGAWDTHLRCIDLATGQLKWQWSNGKSNNLLGPGNTVPILTDDKAVIVAPDRYMTAIDRETGKTLWRDNSHKYRESLGCSEDKTTAYAKTMDGELVAVDIAGDRFNELWLCDMGIGYDHAPCIVAEIDGVIYAGSRRGLLTAVAKDTREVLWQLPLGCSEINGIDIDPADSSVWVSLIEGTIWRIARQ